LSSAALVWVIHPKTLSPEAKAKLERVALELLGPGKSVSIYLPVLRSKGYDIDELTRLVDSYAQLAESARNFTFEMVEELEVATRLVVRRKVAG
jgi:hypothetical protein